MMLAPSEAAAQQALSLAGQLHLLLPLILSFGFFLSWVRSGRVVCETQNPPRVSYLLPWVGSAFDIARDPDTFFWNARHKLGPLFKVKAAGQNMIYVTSPDLIRAVYQDTKTFEFTPIILDLMEKVFRLPHAAAHSLFISEQYLPMHHRLLTPRSITDLLQSYAEHAQGCILKVVEEFNGTCTDLIPFLLHPTYTSAALAFFGRAFDTEGSYGPFRNFDDCFHLMLAEIPRFMMPGPHRAYEKILRIFEDYLETPHDDCSDLVRQLETAARESGMSAREIAAAMSMDLWASQANSPWAVYWLVVLELQKPQGLGRLVAEVDQARTEWRIKHPEDSLEESFPRWILNAPLPLLTSAIYEVLRLSTSSFSIRYVRQPVVFAGYHLDMGERIICATRYVHMNEEIHADAQKYKPERYTPDQRKVTKNGKVVSNHSMPFGGGVSMCEGRHFALGELKIYIALLLTYATLELDPDSTERPRYRRERMGVGVMQPEGDLRVKIRKRDVVLSNEVD